MASLTQDSEKRSPYWICCYVTSTGRRLKRTTKVSIRPEKGELREDGKPATPADKRRQAMEVCLAIERAENMARQGTLTEQAVRRILSETLERTTGHGLRMVSCERWLRDWLEEKRRVRSAGTVERYGYVIEGFLAGLGKRAALPLEAITARDVLDYRDGLLKSGRSRGTAKLNIVNLSVAFNAARRRQLIPFNPCEAVEHLRAEPARRKDFSPEQVAALVSAADGDWRGAILCGFYTGARLGDIAALRWENIDLEKRAIRFVPEKTAASGRAVVVPLHPDLEAELLKAPGVGKAPVFPGLHGRKTSGLGGEFAAIMARAGIRRGFSRHGEGGRRVYELSFHSLRHAFVSALANAGVSPDMRQALAGHSTAAMSENYTHRGLDPLRAAIALLPPVTGIGTGSPGTAAAGERGRA
jgi:integrase